MATRGAVVAAGIATARGPSPVSAAEERLEPVAVAWDDTGTIVFVGPADQLPWPPTLGAPDHGLLVPGFVDCHTHLPFVGWRADEFEARLRGASYRDLHGEEGGIFRSARLLREAGDDEVLEFSGRLLDEMARLGTTTVELKTGYGLSLEGELRQARLAHRLADSARQTCVVTLLACHAVPPDVAREDWVRLACEELIPAAAAEGLMDAVDIYVEDIAFTLDDLERVAEAAAEASVPLRVHADQLGPSAAAETAVRLGARSADHINHCSPAGVAALTEIRDTVAVLLPASTFVLGATPAPASDLRREGAAIAVATDLNPGTSPVCSMPEVVAMAAGVYGIPPLEALAAATINAAQVLGLAERVGTLEPGKRADVVLLDAERFAAVPYRPGHDPVRSVVIGGEIVRPG